MIFILFFVYNDMFLLFQKKYFVIISQISIYKMYIFLYNEYCIIDIYERKGA